MSQTPDEAREPRWHHLGYRGGSHEPQPDLSRVYIQGGSGNKEAPCLGCGTGEVAVFS